MTKLSVVVGAAVGLFGSISLQACTLGSDTYITMQPEVVADAGPPGTSSSDSTPSPTGDACQRGFAKVDLATLTACGDGKGHCYAKDKAPLADQLVPCENAAEVCVPDEILAAGGAKLKSCTSVIGAGGCITAKLLPELERRSAGALTQDACDAGQLCVPCIDPTNNNAPTPFCLAIGVYDKACASTGAGGDGGASTPPPSCCTTKGKSNGVCLSEASLPEGERENAPADTCAEGTKCVPKALVDGKPVTCNAGAILGQGICMDACFNTMLGIAGSIGILSKDVCGESESCVPCRALEGRGVPGCPK